MKETLVAGLGNPLLGDEGVGVHVIRELERRASRCPGADFLDLGTGGMKALHAMAGRRKAVFVDCALMGEAPGVIRRFTDEQVRSRKEMPRLSLHESDLLEVIELSGRIGERPKEVIIFGIEPADVSPGEDLSPTLQRRLGEYVHAVLAESRAPGQGTRPTTRL
jgi:hydrogenase maturation protease